MSMSVHESRDDDRVGHVDHLRLPQGAGRHATSSSPRSHASPFAKSPTLGSQADVTVPPFRRMRDWERRSAPDAIRRPGVFSRLRSLDGLDLRGMTVERCNSHRRTP
jgi:hypothetical protein